MGWLDNSTNNIILDAVLTDYGRRALASGGASPTTKFSITKFALGDDEVNYKIISKYGRTVGREKIEKNTPVFEALTNQNLALKYKLVGIEAPLVYLPQISFGGNEVGLDVGGGPQPVTVSQTLSSSDSSSSIYSSISDTNFEVYYPSLFLMLKVNNAPVMTGAVMLDATRTAHALLTTQKNGEKNNSATFSLEANSLTTSIFSVYGRISGGKQVISTSIKVVGQNSGLVCDVPVTITKN